MWKTIEASVVLDDSEIEVRCGLLSRVILGQNSIQLLDTALDDLFLWKFVLSKPV